MVYGLFSLIIVLLVLWLVDYLIQAYLPVDGMIKQILRIILIVIALWRILAFVLGLGPGSPLVEDYHTSSQLASTEMNLIAN